MKGKRRETPDGVSPTSIAIPGSFLMIQRDEEARAFVEERLLAVWTGERFPWGALKMVAGEAAARFGTRRGVNRTTISRFARRLASALRDRARQGRRQKREKPERVHVQEIEERIRTLSAQIDPAKLQAGLARLPTIGTPGRRKRMP